MPVDKRLLGFVLSELGGIGTLALLLYYLPLSGAAYISDVWATERVVAYVLLFTAPLLLFLPFSLALRLGPLWLLGTGSWALLGYVLLFVEAPGRAEAGFLQYAAFLTFLFVALGSLLAIPLGALSKRLLPAATSTVGMVRAFRQGGLFALFVVSALAMSPLGVLNWLNALLLFTIMALTEFFFLARN